MKPKHPTRHHMLAFAALTSATILLLGATTSMAASQAGLLDMLTGEYNNNEQVWQQKEDKVTEDARNHWHWQQADKETLSLAVAAGQVAPDTQWTFHFTAAQSGGWISQVSTAQGTARKDKSTKCQYRWRQHGSGYLGTMVKQRACDKALPKQWEIDADYLIVRTNNKTEYQARRVIHYTGWMSLKRQQIDPDAEDDDYLFLKDVAFHDEGFVAPMLDDGQPSGYSVELARLTYQNTRTAVLKLGIIEDATGKTLVYSWANPNAYRIGINLRWLQVGLTRTTPPE